MCRCGEGKKGGGEIVSVEDREKVGVAILKVKKEEQT